MTVQLPEVARTIDNYLEVIAILNKNYNLHTKSIIPLFVFDGKAIIEGVDFKLRIIEAYPDIPDINAQGHDGKFYSKSDIQSFGPPGTVIFYSDNLNAEKALEKSSLSLYLAEQIPLK